MERKICIVCRKTKLLNISILENYPISFSPTISSIDSDIYENLYIDGCQECGSIQHRNLYDASFIYNTIHNNTQITQTWSKHHKEFADFIKKSNDKLNTFIEVGGYSGVLAKHIINMNDSINYKIIDLCDKDPKINGVEFENINGEVYDYISSDTVIMSHMFEHLYNPVDFIKKLNDSNIQNIFISIPNMKKYIIDGTITFLNVEHTFYCDLETSQYIFNKCGYIIQNTSYFKDHSIFLHFIKGSIGLPNIEPLLQIQHIKHFIDMRDSYLNGLKLNTDVFIAPAGYFAQLLYYFIKKNNPHIKILGFLDNDISKHGTRVYGTSIVTHPMNYIENFKNTPISIIMNKSPYYNEIKEQLNLYHTNINFISISLNK